jgi:uncharacterized protein (TIGR00251 family)
MKTKIKLHPGSSRNKIEDISRGNYSVWIKEKPIDGKANLALEKLLKKHFGKSVKVIKGLKSRDKIVEVGD